MTINSSVAKMSKLKRMMSKLRGKKKMSDLIDRKEAVEAIKNEMLSWLEGDSHDYRKVVDAIMDLPTVEAEPVRHGHWVIKGDWCTCSVCKQSIHYERSESGKSSIINALSMAVRYCAGCGAKMDERKEENGK